jgi:hypothetical protein
MPSAYTPRTPRAGPRHTAGPPRGGQSWEAIARGRSALPPQAGDRRSVLTATEVRSPPTSLPRARLLHADFPCAYGQRERVRGAPRGRDAADSAVGRPAGRRRRICVGHSPDRRLQAVMRGSRRGRAGRGACRSRGPSCWPAPAWSSRLPSNIGTPSNTPAITQTPSGGRPGRTRCRCHERVRTDERGLAPDGILSRTCPFG